MLAIALEHLETMTSKLSEDTLKWISKLEGASEDVEQDPRSTSANNYLGDTLQALIKIALDEQQRGPMGENTLFSKKIALLWGHIAANVQANDNYLGQLATQEVTLYLARLTRNVAAQCPNNQLWIMRECEPSIRRMLHFFTSWYNAENSEYHKIVIAIAQCLANIVTGNKETAEAIWTQYMNLPERDNVITRLLEYPDRKAVLTTIVFILNALSTSSNHSLFTAQSVGGRLICVHLLEKTDKIFDDEENEDLFHLIYTIFTSLFENGALKPLYESLQPSDGVTSLHQITLLKLLDAYTHSNPSSPWTNSPIPTFLLRTLLSLLQTAKIWTGSDSDAKAEPMPNENLPQVASATVLVSQMLANGLMAEQLEWEKLADKLAPKRPMLEALRDPSDSYVELIIDVLRRLDQLLPRIQFGKVKPKFTGHDPSSTRQQLDASGFQFLKRDLIRLLGIITHDDPSIQDRIRDYGGVQLVLGLCAIDESNPYIREHALFTLRNLLHKNPNNQRIVQEMEPMGKIDENGMLTGL